MSTMTKFFHDKVVLLLLSINAFLTLLTAVSILARLQGGAGGFIVQYRAKLGTRAFEPGNADQIVAFVVLAVLVFAIHLALAWRTFAIRRQLSLIILVLGGLLLILNAIVGNALIALR